MESWRDFQEYEVKCPYYKHKLISNRKNLIQNDLVINPETQRILSERMRI